jgi:hypothetical protein
MPCRLPHVAVQAAAADALAAFGSACQTDVVKPLAAAAWLYYSTRCVTVMYGIATT